MKILFLLDFTPFEEDSDGLSKIYFNLIKKVSQKHDVDLLICGEFESLTCEKKFELKNIWFEKTKCTRLVRLLNLLSLEYPETIQKGQIRNLFIKYNMSSYDIIHTSMFSFSNITSFHSRVVIGATDSLSVSYSGSRYGKLNALKRRFFKLLESNLVKKGGWIHVVTERDRLAYDSDKCFVITNGVDLQKYKPLNHKKVIDGFVFHGNLGYPPNIDAIRFMSQALLRYTPKKLYLVGRGSSKPFSSLKNVIVVGEVADISHEITKYSYYLILMTSGTGVKNKLLEAMSCNCHIIANDLSVNGLAINSHLRSAVKIISSIEELNQIVDYRPSISPRSYVEKYCTWEEFSINMVKKYYEISQY